MSQVVEHPVAHWAPPVAPRRPWLRPLALGLVTVAATAYTGIADPNTSHAFPLCPLKYATGIDCPACGCLRAVHSLTRGDVAGAAGHNIVFVAALPFILVAYGLWVGRSFGLSWPSARVPRQFTLWVLALLVGFGVLRNLPIPGHDFLASGTG